MVCDVAKNYAKETPGLMCGASGNSRFSSRGHTKKALTAGLRLLSAGEVNLSELGDLVGNEVKVTAIKTKIGLALIKETDALKRQVASHRTIDTGSCGTKAKQWRLGTEKRKGRRITRVDLERSHVWPRRDKQKEDCSRL
ncbi:hypothetical protein ERJ75_000897300 [Trypanosoma vivax]|nr:hypothetical protein ERJ75_000897300 [Trypanosoma vivax]